MAAKINKPSAAVRKATLTKRNAATTDKLNLREQRFVIEYAVDYNGSAAAQRAGYAKSGAAAVAKRLLSNPLVSKYVDRLMAKRQEDTGITAARIMEELAKIGFASMGDYMAITSSGDPYADLSELTPEQAAAIQEFTVEDFTEGRGEDARDVRRVKIKLYDKRAALVDMGKQLGMWPNKRELTGPGGGPVQVVTSEMTPKEAATAYLEMLKAGA